MYKDQLHDASESVASSLMGAEMDRRQVFLRGAALGLGASAFAATLGKTGIQASAQADTTGMVTVAEQQRQTWIRNFNFLVPGNTALWPSDNGIYEPLMIASRITGQITPWLAESHEYTADNLGLTLKIRQGVKWSDGTDFTASDVAFTFNLLKNNAALSGAGAIRNILDNSTSITAPDSATVTFVFTEVYSPGLYDIIAQNIVPEHIWSAVADPITFLNETPVGTGPFTEVSIFTSQYFELRRNPYYWQAEKIGIAGLRFPIFGDNDTAQRALVSGEVDWAGKFIPDIQSVYVDQDPTNFGYWFPATGDTVHLYLNTTVAPFDNVEVRKAFSMAIDRADIVSFAMYDYVGPADSTGLSGGYPAWKNAQYATAPWMTFDAEAAAAAMDAAGMVMDGDVRTYNGAPMVYELLVVNGWTDWNQSCQIMADNLGELGISVTVLPLDQVVWQERVQKGDFTLSIGWSSGGVTPFNFYRGVMSSQTRNEIGTSSAENWHRFASPEADAMLDQFAATSDPVAQTAAANELQRIFSEQVPALPLFPGPQWYEYNATRFDGWPTEANPYAVPSTYSGERLLVMTRLTSKIAIPAMETPADATPTTGTPALGTPSSATPIAGTPTA